MGDTIPSNKLKKDTLPDLPELLVVEKHLYLVSEACKSILGVNIEEDEFIKAISDIEQGLSVITHKFRENLLKDIKHVDKG